MLAKIKNWGNSQGLRLPKNLLEDAKLSVGDEVEVSVQDGVIKVAPHKRMRGRYSLEDLAARTPEKQTAGEMAWGGPVGREEW